MVKTVQIDFPSELVTEGKAQLVVPQLKAYGVCPSDYAPSRAPVFYNPVMEFNRDLTVLAFQAYQRTVNRDIAICEPLTATGIRAIRFAAEIQGVKKVVSGDINSHSVALAQHNVEINSLQDIVTVKNKDADRLLGDFSAPKKRFDIVDLDPFGTPVTHLESAIRALRNNGLLAVTATDMAPLCGVHPKACIRKYGGKPLRTEYCQELAVRLLAGAMATAAAKNDVGIHVLLAHSSDHYIRVYAQIRYGAKRADESLKNLGYVLHCFGCQHRETTHRPFPEKPPTCPECGKKMDYAGPLWVASIFDKSFIQLMIEENKRTAFRNSAKISKLLYALESEADLPATYYVLDKLSGKMGLPAPAVTAFLQALQKDGFKAVQTHFNSRGVRTEASALAVQKAVQSIVGGRSQ